jgi:hypothetical protein
MLGAQKQRNRMGLVIVSVSTVNAHFGRLGITISAGTRWSHVGPPWPCPNSGRLAPFRRPWGGTAVSVSERLPKQVIAHVSPPRPMPPRLVPCDVTSFSVAAAFELQSTRSSGIRVVARHSLTKMVSVHPKKVHGGNIASMIQLASESCRGPEI